MLKDDTYQRIEAALKKGLKAPKPELLELIKADLQYQEALQAIIFPLRHRSEVTTRRAMAEWGTAAKKHRRTLALIQALKKRGFSDRMANKAMGPLPSELTWANNLERMYLTAIKDGASIAEAQEILFDHIRKLYK